MYRFSKIRRLCSCSGLVFVIGFLSQLGASKAGRYLNRYVLTRGRSAIDRVGSLWEDNGLIFASETGHPLKRRGVVKYQFKNLLKRAGLPNVCFHDLRHTCATLLLGTNVNLKTVSEMLGHASIAITLDTYSHVLPHMQNEATKALEDALS